LTETPASYLQATQLLPAKCMAACAFSITYANSMCVYNVKATNVQGRL